MGINKQKQTKNSKANTRGVTDNTPDLSEWQRKFDPLNFNKARGAQYHTAPTVLYPDDMGYPDGVPENSVTILFFIDETSWIGEPEKMSIDYPMFIEKEPQRGAKHAPVFILDTERAYAAIPVKENYYWSAQVLSEHEVVRVEFKPNKSRTDGKTRKIIVTATFIPNDGE